MPTSQPYHNLQRTRPANITHDTWNITTLTMWKLPSELWKHNKYNNTSNIKQQT